MTHSKDDLDWQRDGPTWPHHRRSRFIEAGGLRWHVQMLGHGPTLLLVHGTGASTHSWEDLATLLSRRFTVVAVDLPGHGFTAPLARAEISITTFSRALGHLLSTLGVSTAIAVGHSAGAAVLIRMALDGLPAPKLIIGLNAALLPFPGPAGHAFPLIARLIYTNTLVPRFFAWRASRREAVARLLASTGSDVPARSIDYYARLFRSPAHVAATLNMMANWDLAGLKRALPSLTAPLLLLAGGRDRTVDPAQADEVAALCPSTRVRIVPFVGHLMHEEAPETIADIIIEEVARADIPDNVANCAPSAT